MLYSPFDFDEIEFNYVQYIPLSEKQCHVAALGRFSEIRFFHPYPIKQGFPKLCNFFKCGTGTLYGTVAWLIITVYIKNKIYYHVSKLKDFFRSTRNYYTLYGPSKIHLTKLSDVRARTCWNIFGINIQWKWRYCKTLWTYSDKIDI